MSASGKITTLLADGDPLRHDELAAILNAASETVVAVCADGQTGLDEIRRLRPDIAVVDLEFRCSAELRWPAG
jgi:DNA-binding NarL/FixJ family response regulator